LLAAAVIIGGVVIIISMRARRPTAGTAVPVEPEAEVA
jgi:hypothetical protein